MVLTEPDAYENEAAQAIFDELAALEDIRARIDAEMYRKLGCCLGKEVESKDSQIIQ